eukprot:95903_1
MEAVCILLGVAPVKVGAIGEKGLDYWEPEKKHLLPNSKFLNRLREYDKDNIDPDIMAKIQASYSKNSEFEASKIAKANGIAKICEECLTEFLPAYEMATKPLKCSKRTTLWRSKPRNSRRSTMEAD